jgi:hypothetical protein
VESVAWATGFRDLLGGALAILSLLFYLRDRPRIASGVMLLSVLSKPTSIMLLPMVVVMDWLWFQRAWRAIFSRTWAMVSVAIIGGILTLWAQPQIHRDVSVPWQRPFIALDAVAFYLWKLFVPIHLVFDYSRKPAAIVMSGQIWWTWIVPVALAIVMLFTSSRKLKVAALWFLLPLLPVLGLVPFAFQSISTVADHYAYLSMIGVAMAAAMLIRNVQTLRISAVIVVVLAIQSFQLAGKWHDDLTYFTYASQVNPRSAPAWNGLAAYYLAENQVDLAEQASDHALQADPEYGFAHFTRIGICLRKQDDAGVERELQAYLDAMQRQKNYDPKQAELVRTLVEQRKRQQLRPPGER